MRKSTFSGLFISAIVVLIIFQSCKNDAYLTTPLPVPDQSFSEEFDTTTAALSRGWKFINASDPVGPGVWQQGGSIPPWFNSYSNNGNAAGFIGADYTSTSAGSATISNWVVSPLITMQNGDKIVFYTRALLYDIGGGDSTDFGNSLQVRINTLNQSTNVGLGLDPGDFTTGLLAINGNFDYYSVLHPVSTAYPARWTRFEATVFGLDKPVKGRFAFRYFVIDGGSAGNGSGVGIDKVTYTSVNH